MNELLFFLEANEQNDVWLVVPGGLISGKLQTITSKEAKTVFLNQAVLITGEATIDLDKATVLLSQVSVWGDGLPVFINPTGD